jgi:hypothetical protein
MAKRHLSVIALGLISLATMVGCQQPMSSQANYVSPSFDGPRLAAAAVQPMLPVVPPPTFHVPPPPAPKAVRPPAVATSVPRAWTPPVAARPWRWIVIHHSDTETGGAAAFDKMHRAKGWDMLGYDFVVGNGTDTADGQVEVGPRWTRQLIGAHAKTPDNRFNEYGIGICLVGDMMNHPPTAKQMASVERLTAYLMATYRIAPDHILGHGDTKATDCPGRYTNLSLIRTVAAREAGGAAAYASAYARPVGEMLVQVTNP